MTDYSLITVHDGRLSNYAEALGTLGKGAIRPTKCEVTEQVNGPFSASLELPYDSDRHYKRICGHDLIRIPVVEHWGDVDETPYPPDYLGFRGASYNQNQLFRVTKIAYKKDVMSIEANHIFYDLDNIVFLETDKVRSWVNASTLFPRYNFNIYSDPRLGRNVDKEYDIKEIIASAGSDYEKAYRDVVDMSKTKVELKVRSALDYLLNSSDGVLATNGGYIFRNNDVIVVRRFPHDDFFPYVNLPIIESDIVQKEIIAKNTKQAVHGKNVIELDYELDFSNMVEGIYFSAQNSSGKPWLSGPYWSGELTPRENAGSGNITPYGYYDFNDLKLGEKGKSTGKTIDKAYAEKMMAIKAQMLFLDGSNKPKEGISATFTKTHRSDILYQLKNVKLGDLVKVRSPRFEGGYFEQNVMEYTYDCLRQEYTSISIGNPRESLLETISKSTS